MPGVVYKLLHYFIIFLYHVSKSGVVLENWDVMLCTVLYLYCTTRYWEIFTKYVWWWYGTVHIENFHIYRTFI